MIVGVPKEIKNNEFRVGMTPGSVREFVHHGHTVLVEKGAARARRSPTPSTSRAGAKMVDTADEVFATADMIVKVKEPQAVEIAMLRPGQILYTYLHLAPDYEQTMGLIGSGAVCIAYETVELPNGSLPLLAPMSEVAGRMATTWARSTCRSRSVAAACSWAASPACCRPSVVVLGGGVVGTQRRRTWRSAWAPTSRSWTSTSTASATSTSCGATASARSTASTTSSRPSTPPTSSSAPCCCRAPRRRASSPRTCSRT